MFFCFSWAVWWVGEWGGRTCFRPFRCGSRLFGIFLFQNIRFTQCCNMFSSFISVPPPWESSFSPSLLPQASRHLSPPPTVLSFLNSNPNSKELYQNCISPCNTIHCQADKWWEKAKWSLGPSPSLLRRHSLGSSRTQMTSPKNVCVGD